MESGVSPAYSPAPEAQPRSLTRLHHTSSAPGRLGHAPIASGHASISARPRPSDREGSLTKPSSRLHCPAPEPFRCPKSTRLPPQNPLKPCEKALVGFGFSFVVSNRWNCGSPRLSTNKGTRDALVPPGLWHLLCTESLVLYSHPGPPFPGASRRAECAPTTPHFTPCHPTLTHHIPAAIESPERSSPSTFGA